MTISIKKAEYIKEYKIRLLFSDGKERIIDFKNFLKHTKNPMTKTYLDLNKLKNFRIKYGDLIWGDYELCFPLADLYEDNISKKISMAA